MLEWIAGFRDTGGKRDRAYAQLWAHKRAAAFTSEDFRNDDEATYNSDIMYWVGKRFCELSVPAAPSTDGSTC